MTLYTILMSLLRCILEQLWSQILSLSRMMVCTVSRPGHNLYYNSLLHFFLFKHIGVFCFPTINPFIAVTPLSLHCHVHNVNFNFLPFCFLFHCVIIVKFSLMYLLQDEHIRFSKSYFHIWLWPVLEVLHSQSFRLIFCACSKQNSKQKVLPGAWQSMFFVGFTHQFPVQHRMELQVFCHYEAFAWLHFSISEGNVGYLCRTEVASCKSWQRGESCKSLVPLAKFWNESIKFWASADVNDQWARITGCIRRTEYVDWKKFLSLSHMWTNETNHISLKFLVGKCPPKTGIKPKL